MVALHSFSVFTNYVDSALFGCCILLLSTNCLYSEKSIFFNYLQDYMGDVHGKQIPLQYVTVKVPGQKPRGSRATLPPSNGLSEGLSSLSISSYLGKDRRLHEGVKEPGESKVTFKLFKIAKILP